MAFGFQMAILGIFRCTNEEGTVQNSSFATLKQTNKKPHPIIPAHKGVLGPSLKTKAK